MELRDLSAQTAVENGIGTKRIVTSISTLNRVDWSIRRDQVNKPFHHLTNKPMDQASEAQPDFVEPSTPVQ